MDPKDQLVAKLKEMLWDSQQRTRGDYHWLEVAYRRLEDRSFLLVDPHLIRQGLERAGKRDPENADVTEAAREAIRKE